MENNKKKLSDLNKSNKSENVNFLNFHFDYIKGEVVHRKLKIKSLMDLYKFSLNEKLFVQKKISNTCYFFINFKFSRFTKFKTLVLSEFHIFDSKFVIYALETNQTFPRMMEVLAEAKEKYLGSELSKKIN
ncbi:hypothetical protein BpHYR1_011676 [Brachionus plicatilis]|uniref:Uncharacterized protein n=1 Tax=Brachionus plicatilis TaxID=10195 RepID=A0A3M7PHI0_BRAPC|nr:hypothetical protein BpHYR1_011676 [Brachionus plicatilis]